MPYFFPSYLISLRTLFPLVFYFGLYFSLPLILYFSLVSYFSLPPYFLVYNFSPCTLCFLFYGLKKGD